MPRAKVLTLGERQDIAKYLADGLTPYKIAKILGRCFTTVYKEIKRNSVDGKYIPNQAQKLYKLRYNYRRNASKLEQGVMTLVEDYLKLTWSPEEISKVLKIEHNINLSFNTIYRWLYNGYLHLDKKVLRRKGKKYRKRNFNYMDKRKTKNIKHRPKIKKFEFGHWELDTIVSPHNEKGCLVTIVEKSSSLVKAIRLKNRTALTVSRAIVKLLKNEIVKTITTDNGREFADYEYIEKMLNTTFYFCDPGKSWQKAQNEYHNGLLREFFPKKTIFEYVSQQAVYKAVKLINNRPMKKHRWKSRNYIFHYLRGKELINI